MTPPSSRCAAARRDRTAGGARAPRRWRRGSGELLGVEPRLIGSPGEPRRSAATTTCATRAAACSRPAARSTTRSPPGASRSCSPRDCSICMTTLPTVAAPPPGGARRCGSTPTATSTRPTRRRAASSAACAWPPPAACWDAGLGDDAARPGARGACAGVRDLDGGERVLLERARRRHLAARQARGALDGRRGLRAPRPRRARPDRAARRSSRRPAACRARGCATCSASVAEPGDVIGARGHGRSTAPEDEDERDAARGDDRAGGGWPTARRASLLRPLVEELHERRAPARLGGGEERIAKQHAADKLTARERLDAAGRRGHVHRARHPRRHPLLRARDGGQGGARRRRHHRLRQGRRAAGRRLRLRLHGHGRLDGHDRRDEGHAPARARADQADAVRVAARLAPARASRRRSARCSPAPATCSARR